MARYGLGTSAVILIHGFGTSSFLWRAVAPLLAAEGSVVFAIDMLGYGESDRPYGADFGIAEQAELIDQAMTALRIGRATVVGVDVGGGVALRLAATRPERVDRLVLINTIAFDDFPGRDLRTIQRNTARFAIRVSRGVLGVAPLLTSVLEGSVADPARMPARLVGRYLAPYVGAEGVNHLLVLTRSIRTEDLDELDLGKIRAPTLVIWGDLDTWLDDRIPDKLVNAIPDARLVRFPRMARLIPEEDPEGLAELLRDFMAGRTVG